MAPGKDAEMGQRWRAMRRNAASKMGVPAAVRKARLTAGTAAKPGPARKSRMAAQRCMFWNTSPTAAAASPASPAGGGSCANMGAHSGQNHSVPSGGCRDLGANICHGFMRPRAASRFSQTHIQKHASVHVPRR